MLNKLFQFWFYTVKFMKKITLNVKGMHCPSCEMLIKDSLGELDGVNKVKASYKKGTVKVFFDESQIDEDKIRTVINNERYKVE